MSRITVRRAYEQLTFRGGTEHEYRAKRVWRVYIDGQRVRSARVVDSAPGLTLVLWQGARGWQMHTCWHIGLGPGDIARRYLLAAA